MTPNLAQGANSAIESAASLANHIVGALDANQRPWYGLSHWASSRKRRMRFFYVCSWILARCESFANPLYKQLGLHIGIRHAGQVISHISDISSKSEYLHFLPDNVHCCASQYKSPRDVYGSLHDVLVALAFVLMEVVLVFWDIYSKFTY
jgi:hypothetical protein